MDMYEGEFPLFSGRIISLSLDELSRRMTYYNAATLSPPCPFLLAGSLWEKHNS